MRFEEHDPQEAAVEPTEKALVAHVEWLRRLARLLVADADDGDDAVQDTCLDALRQRPRPGPGMREWLKRVLLRHAAHQRARTSRREAWERAAARPEAMPSALEIADQLALQRQLSRAVAVLPEAQRVAIWMRFWEQMPPRVIAQRLGVPVETVRTRLKRALTALCETLERTRGSDWKVALLPIAGLSGETGSPVVVAASGLSATALGTGVIALKTKIGFAAGIAVCVALIGSWYAWPALRDASERPVPQPNMRELADYAPTNNGLEVRRTTTAEPTIALLEKPVPAPIAEGIPVRVLAKATEEPIAGARVLVIDAERAVHARAVTDADGICRVAWPNAGEPIEVIANAEGFADRRIQVSNRPLDAIQLSLEEPLTIKGRVTLYDGRIPSFPVRVYAWTSFGHPSPRDFDLADRGEPVMLSCTTREGGEFKLLGAASGARYTVAAGAPGWTVRELKEEADDASFLELRLERMFGLVLRAKLEGGGDAPHSRLWSCGSDEPIDSASKVYFPSAQASCAGVRELAGVPQMGSDWRTIETLYCAPQDDGQIGPAARQYRVPGFELNKVEFYLPATEGETVAERTVTFIPSSLGVGTLRIRFEGPLELGKAASALWLSPHQVLLESLSAAAPSHQVPFKDPSRGVVDFDALPCGPYRLSILIGDGRWFPRDAPEHVIHVGPEPLEVQVPVEAHGAVLLRPSKYNADLRGAGLEVHAGRAGRNFQARYVFQRGPYVLSGLREAAYELKISAHQRDGKPVTITLSDVQVQAGKVVEQTFDW
jgi:RNA polymerase sigma-70 factor (ECF subfamily)